MVTRQPQSSGGRTENLVPQRLENSGCRGGGWWGEGKGRCCPGKRPSGGRGRGQWVNMPLARRAQSVLLRVGARLTGRAAGRREQ